MDERDYKQMNKYIQEENKIKNNNKNSLRFILNFLLGVSFFYLCVSFVRTHIDFTLWEEKDRIFYVFLCICYLLILPFLEKD